MSRNNQTSMNALTLAALGVVYGDIGTSPLYAMRESMHALGDGAELAENVLGVLSLIVWTLIITVTTKYVMLVTRADNDGEGGILALMALARPGGTARNGRWGRVVLLAGMIGASLLYGEGIITPAISVLSAVEGLQIAWPATAKLVLPLTMIILYFLFAAQSRGTAAVGRVFGPIMVAWFLTLGSLGLWSIIQHPGVLAALSPVWAVRFLVHQGLAAGPVIGGAFLCATGGESLYADMGHFGAVPIRRAWFIAVLPGLVLNYFGQGAVLLASPETAHTMHPFYAMAPGPLLIPLVLLAMMATVIASQALISGAFSLTSQAIQLGFLPRMEVVHTSAEEYGQIYVPLVRNFLLVGCILLVAEFKSSSALAAAYGLAVTMTMLITTVLFAGWARLKAGWSMPKVLAVCVPFGILEIGFLSANVTKIPDGGWFPLTLGMFIYVVMSTWRMGRKLMVSRIHDRSVDLDVLQRIVGEDQVYRPPGIAVFMTSDPTTAPDAMYRNYAHNRVMHQHNMLVTVRTVDSPYVPHAERMKIEPRGEGFWSITLEYGFMESPDVPRALAGLPAHGLPWDESVTYFLGRDNAVRSVFSSAAGWRVAMFAFLARNAQQAATYFRIPPGSVVEIGAQIDL